MAPAVASGLWLSVHITSYCGTWTLWERTKRLKVEAVYYGNLDLFCNGGRDDGDHMAGAVSVGSLPEPNQREPHKLN